MNPKPIEEKLVEYARALMIRRKRKSGPQDMRLLERLVMLRVIDSFGLNI